MWAAGAVAAMSSITFPAISALVSRNAEADQQGEYWINCCLCIRLLFCVESRRVCKCNFSGYLCKFSLGSTSGNLPVYVDRKEVHKFIIIAL